MIHNITELAAEVLLREAQCRTETDWIQKMVDRLAEAEGLKSRAETDRIIFEKMYGRAPEKTESTKIRYWRTGHHLPAGRDEALLFAEALGLDRAEKDYFLQACMEKSDLLFETPPEPGDGQYSRYRERRELMETMISEYIAFLPPARMFGLNIPYKNLGAYVRHLYCMDALSATALAAKDCGREAALSHLSSSNYESEFLRTRKLLGEIPRRTMLRQIILLGIPYLNRRLTDMRLEALGYLPLTEGHTNPQGALTDDLVIGFLGLYEEACAGKEPLVCRQWCFEQLSILDRFLLEHGKEAYRFMYFRILATMADEKDSV